MKQSSCKIIGLTGGIASGKSTVTNLLMGKGFKVIDADKIARKVVCVGEPAYMDIVDEFGERILNEDLSIDRIELGKLTFQDGNMRKRLNSIVHPRIFQAIKDEVDKYSKIEKFIFLDIPLLVEELEKIKAKGINIDEIWLVYVDEKTQLERLKKRDGFSDEEALARMRAQMSMEYKKKYADKIINNSGSLEELKEKVEILTKSLK
ncbi:dephospho-CoA kinase [Sporanaerobacter acetigenes]|uniref:Dephospho-CoA kinase n=1 Tax=Sporanaerobacter acetigenes DSM 13106 TaxID=1123281 RepID=A0A1M5UZ51_9FIRM|nr:dephospho-CoA kinase [Sporanaerobacter acetigenes]SHH68285.1 dephospho-CoA kinase [Sporanaerobacter acetigenes DSM 13106]